MFAGAVLEIEDILLLESFQISMLPGWIPEEEFGIVLSARPDIARYLITRCPGIETFIRSMVGAGARPDAVRSYEECCDTVVWTIADLLVYNKCPEVYDSLPFHNWDFAEVTSIVDLSGRAVIDGGAGTGRVALEAAETASTVYAVEPVSRLRQFIRERAISDDLPNVYVVDGFLNSLPFPDSYADVVITSHALGWDLQQELKEFERVVRSEGVIIHCPGTAVGADDRQHSVLISEPWNYCFAEFDEADGRKRKYWKSL